MERKICCKVCVSCADGTFSPGNGKSFITNIDKVQLYRQKFIVCTSAAHSDSNVANKYYLVTAEEFISILSFR